MIKPVDYKQGDAKWGDVPYAVDGESSTIKSAGCGPTAMADVLAALVSTYIDPLTLASWSRMKGYKVYKSGTSYSFPVAVAKEYGVTCQRLNTSNVYGKIHSSVHQVALKELQSGNWLIACMGKGNWTKSGHYVVAYRWQQDKVYIMDPASNRANRLCNTWELFKSQVKYYWVVQVPEKIRTNGAVTGGEYRQEDQIRELQMCLKAGITGKADALTLAKTVSVSSKKNKKHAVVHPLQKILKKLTLYSGELDRSCGPGMTKAINSYQEQVLGYGKQDGEITARGKMWRSLLKL